MSKELILEKYIKVAVRKALKEVEQQQQKAEKSMYLLHRFPGLKKAVEDIMSPAFGRYISNINIVSPKPTTFKIDLINGQDFSIYYLGRNNFEAKIAGKKYYLKNTPDIYRASQGITGLLELNYAPLDGETSPKDQFGGGSTSPQMGGGGESGDTASRAADLAADLANPNQPLPPEAGIPPADALPSPELTDNPEELG